VADFSWEGLFRAESASAKKRTKTVDNNIRKQRDIAPFSDSMFNLLAINTTIILLVFIENRSLDGEPRQEDDAFYNRRRLSSQSHLSLTQG